ncbi:hypothetical protein D3C87_1348140 [compost metagenome]
MDFRRILGRGDIDVALVQHVQERIERHRLAAAGGAGDQHHPVRPLDHLQQQRLLRGLVAELVDVELVGRGFQNPHHDLLAEQRGQRGDAEVDRFLDDLLGVLVLGQREQQLHAAVLRHALFRDVQARQHLDPGGDLVADIERRTRHFLQHAVHAEAHAVEELEGLEVQVRCAALEGFGQQLLEEAHHGGIVDFVARRALAGAGRSGHRVVLDHLGGGGRHGGDVLHRPERLAGGAHVLHQLVVLHHHGFHRQVELLLDGVHTGLVGRVGQRHDEPVLTAAQRQQAVGVEFAVAGQRGRHAVEVVLGQVQQRQLVLVGGEDGHVVGRHGAAADDLVNQLRLLLPGRLLKLRE